MKLLRHTLPTLILSLALSLEGNPAQQSNMTAVDLPTAIQMAIENSPRLAVQSALKDAARGQIAQASIRPNPILGSEIENILGTGPMEGIDGMEITLGITQQIERGQKREKRTELARKKAVLLDGDEAIERFNLELQVRQLFSNAILEQERIRIRSEMAKLAETVLKETQTLADAALVNSIKVSEAYLDLEKHRLSLRQATSTLEELKSALSSLWGFENTSDFTLTGLLNTVNALPEFEELLPLLDRNAWLVRFALEEGVRDAEIEIEKAKAVGDITLFGGARYFNQTSSEAALIVGFEMPWNIFDRNSGNIQTARAQKSATALERVATRRQLLSQLKEAYMAITTTRDEIRHIDEELLPAANNTLSKAKEAYEAGRITLLSVLRIQQTVFDWQEARLAALGRMAQAQHVLHVLTKPSY